MEKKLSLGEADKEPQIAFDNEEKNIEEGSMLMSGNHPFFRRGGDDIGSSKSQTSISVPPGARFDPITPEGFNPHSNIPCHPSGEPDPDELLPPNLTLPSKKNNLFRSPFGSGRGGGNSGAGGPFNQRF